MAKKAEKQAKAVEKIKNSIRKAVGKGVSATVVSAAVEDAIGATADTDDGEPGIDGPAAAKAVKMPNRNKDTDVTRKRGMNALPMKPHFEKPSRKKLPGKRKPPTLKQGKTY